MLCPKCKKEIPDNSSFCPQCGYKIETRQEKTARRKLVFRRIAIVAAVALTAGVIGTLTFIDSKPETQYKKAEKAFETGKYEKAVKYYTAAGDYEDAAEKLYQAECATHYEVGVALMDKEDYMTAREELKASEKFEDAEDLIKRCEYNIGLEYLDNKDYENAAVYLKSSQYEDYNDKILQIGKTLVEDGNYATAVKVYDNAQNTGNDDYAQYAQGMVSLSKKEYADAADYFKLAGDILDAEDQYKEAQYNNASNSFSSKKYQTAKTAFSNIPGYKDADDLAIACDLMMGKQDMADGKLNAAKDILESLPKDYSYENVSVSSLLDQLNSNSNWVAVCGKWISTSGEASANCKSNISSYDGGTWTATYDEGDHSLNINCILNNDGTVSITGKGAILVLTEWSTVRIGVKYDTDYPINFEKKVNSADFGKAIQIDEYTTLTMGKDKLAVKYYNKDKDSTIHFYYTYTANVSYKKESDS